MNADAERFGQLRHLLHQSPSQATWLAITRLIEAWPVEVQRAEIVPYVARHLQRWPASLRLASRSWCRVPRPPKLALARRLLLKVVYWGSPGAGIGTIFSRICEQLRHEELRDLEVRPDGSGLRSLHLAPDWVPPLDRAKIEVVVRRCDAVSPHASGNRFLLEGADAIVLVVDSQHERRQSNLRALVGLAHTLSMHHGSTLEDVDVVLQLSKRDKPDAVDVETMRHLVDRAQRWPVVESCASEPGDTGALEGFGLAINQVRAQLLQGQPSRHALRRR